MIDRLNSQVPRLDHDAVAHIRLDNRGNGIVSRGAGAAKEPTCQTPHLTVGLRGVLRRDGEHAGTRDNTNLPPVVSVAEVLAGEVYGLTRIAACA